MSTCAHPLCVKPSRGKFCGRHYYALPEDIRVRLKYAKTAEDKEYLLTEAIEFFEDRRIGQLEITTCNGRAPDYDNGCGAEIVWMVTGRGKNIPVDVDKVELGDDLFNPDKHVAHWATCPNAESFRK